MIQIRISLQSTKVYCRAIPAHSISSIIMCIDHIMRLFESELVDRGNCIDANTSALAAAYPDDILVCAESIDEAQFLAGNVRELLNQFGMKLNVSNTDAYVAYIRVHGRLPNNSDINLILSTLGPIPVLQNNVCTFYILYILEPNDLQNKQRISV